MLQAFRVATLLVGGFAFGMTTAVLLLYLRVRNAFDGNVPVYHVPLVCLSHLLLILSAIIAILLRVHHHDRFAWWTTPLSAVAFVLTSFILVQMLRSDRLRGLQKKGGVK